MAVVTGSFCQGFCLGSRRSGQDQPAHGGHECHLPRLAPRHRRVAVMQGIASTDAAPTAIAVQVAVGGVSPATTASTSRTARCRPFWFVGERNPACRTLRAFRARTNIDESETGPCSGTGDPHLPTACTIKVPAVYFASTPRKRNCRMVLPCSARDAPLHPDGRVCAGAVVPRLVMLGRRGL